MKWIKRMALDIHMLKYHSKSLVYYICEDLGDFVKDLFNLKDKKEEKKNDKRT